MKTAVILAVVLVASPAWAQYKCTGPDGSVSFQQAPCPDAAQAKRLDLPKPPPPDGRDHVRLALAEGRYITGMTRAELDQVMGAPASVTRSFVAGKWHEQVVYRYPGRTVYMYLTDGVLDSFQDSEHARR